MLGPSIGEVITFDRERFSVRSDLKKKIVFDRRTLLLYPINETVAGLLERLSSLPPEVDLANMGLPLGVFEWLLNKEFVVRRPVKAAKAPACWMSAA